MKRCPKCGQEFNDDNLSFCLMDGEALVSTASEPTLVIPPPGASADSQTPPKKKRRTFLWLALAFVVLVVGAGLLVGVAFISYKIGNERARSNKELPLNTTTTPASAPVSRNSATPTPAPVGSPSTSSSPEDESVEVTPILWNTSATQVKQDEGLTYKFECPKNGTPAAVWGNDVYTTDSSICTAAVHAGKITLNAGGQVTIEMRPGRAIYGSTTRNGITSNTYGQYPNSFVFR
jgi:hypothetical protein